MGKWESACSRGDVGSIAGGRRECRSKCRCELLKTQRDGVTGGRKGDAWTGPTCVVTIPPNGGLKIGVDKAK
ncbi:MAG: hypothetical protein KatS3mg112_0194 [Thermogutta sp.]|nr:MAG: hypothetical protein KatS3mg112_0194 [Thermogutta sp.]